jgi:CRISPR-associated protein Csb2
MERCLCLSFRFLQRVFHGRHDAGQPEWPPSPLRAFQALVQAAARLGAGSVEGDALESLTWLEALPAPSVLAPRSELGRSYTLSVPNNAMDIVAAAWSRGNESNTGDANPATHRTMKAVRPLHFVDGDTVRYLWPADDAGASRHVDVISRLTRAVSALGWGVDVVVGDAALLSFSETETLSGERWEPGGRHDGGLRVPRSGTLDALRERHRCFLSRITPSGFVAPPPLLGFDRIVYRRACDVAAPPAALFWTLEPDASALTSFDLVRRGLTVAGLTRHAVRRAAQNAGWDESTINAVVLGHAEPDAASGTTSWRGRRFAYVPLPSIEPRAGRVEVVGRVRRVLICGLGAKGEQDVRWLGKGLSGSELVAERTGQVVALLSLMPANDRVLLRYTKPASTWATVTPVVLPGHDDPAHYRRRLEEGTTAEEQRQLLARLDSRIEGLLRKALIQAGCPVALAERAELEWRMTGFWEGTDLANRYGVPDHLRRFARLHVRIRWRDEGGKPLRVPGPLCVGGGRFYGIGLFAGCREDGCGAMSALSSPIETRSAPRAAGRQGRGRIAAEESP